MSQPRTAITTATEFLGAPIPQGLRELTTGMSWDDLMAVYGQQSGPIRLGRWECADSDRPASRLGPQPREYRATIAVGDRIAAATAAASGPVAALTAMLHEHGIPLETKRFHQRRCGDHGSRTVTFLRGSDGLRDEWAIGVADDATGSALNAVIACANRLRG